MTSTSVIDKTAQGGDQEPENFLTCASGVKSWLGTLDHKRIGIMYLICITFAFTAAGLMALVIRSELFYPDQQLVSPSTYNQLFTLHGAMMVFLFIIPGIPAALGNFVIPMMLGAKDVAFPKLNLTSWYLWVTGAVFFVCALGFGGLDTGWTLYPPYSTTTSSAVVLSVLGAFILGFSSIATGINFVVTIQKMRPEGMGWFQMPLSLWAFYATAVIQVLATPVLGITLLMLIAERTLDVGFFSPSMGGDPVLFQHFFWFYSHPAVYIMILPAMGVISELITTFSHKRPFSYSFIAYSSIAIAIFGFLVWGHHMFTTQSPVANMIFSLLTFSVSIPSAVKVFNWLTTMYKGSISLATPMMHALSFLLLFTIGGLTGLFLGTLATDIPLHDTYFVVAHFHYVMMGGTFVAFLGALYYWWPKMFGRMYNEFWGRIAAVGVFIGFNLTFFPQFIAGSQGMPRRYFDYLPQFTVYHQWSTVGAFVLGGSILIAALNLLSSLRNGPKAPANPWGSPGLEWVAASPPSHYNFDEDVPGRDPYDMELVEWGGSPEVGYIPSAKAKAAFEEHRKKIAAQSRGAH
ncbi:MAG: cbb3-type cytochrome c oxidase subunit I [Planctomycetes bacterium]|nr:cbb3-type cytochrome c oxidase subunit I [Planctomycetota bacterium]